MLITRKDNTYWKKPHHFKNPNCKSQIHHEDDEQEQDEQVQAALPPAIDADFVDILALRPLDLGAFRGGHVLLLHHLLGRGQVDKETGETEENSSSVTLIYTNLEKNSLCSALVKHF